MSEFYSSDYATGIGWNDPKFRIVWPLENQIIFEKDNSFVDFLRNKMKLDNSVNFVKKHYLQTFSEHGTTSKGVDWGSDEDVQVRYHKMLEVMNHDYEKPIGTPRLLDVGCGWGGLLDYCQRNNIDVTYTGIDIVPKMIDSAQNSFQAGTFIQGNVLDFQFEHQYDYVVGSGVLALKLNDNIPQTELYMKNMVIKMFEICKYGCAFNLMSNRVNFMVDKLYYKSPVEFLNFCLDISPRVKVDHAYTCLGRTLGKLFEYTVYIYKNIGNNHA